MRSRHPKKSSRKEASCTTAGGSDTTPVNSRPLSQGNFSNVKSVGSGVHESKIDFGPGYRMYFGKDGERLVLLLGGGTKKRQQRDIAAAIDRWRDYKRRKKQETQ